MKYKLINTKTKEEHLCDKVTIDGMDYYVSDELPKLNDAVITAVGNIHYIKDDAKDFIEYVSKLGKVLIATNNPNIDVPQVVDEVERTAMDNLKTRWPHLYTFGYPQRPFPTNYENDLNCVLLGYNKSQETHPFSEEDMIEFHKWVNQPHPEDNRQPTAVYVKNIDMWWYNHNKYTSKELLQLWEEQKPIKIYYE